MLVVATSYFVYFVEGRHKPNLESFNTKHHFLLEGLIHTTILLKVARKHSALTCCYKSVFRSLMSGPYVVKGQKIKAIYILCQAEKR